MSNNQVKTYTAGSMREALGMVRQDLGPDALIISQQRIGSKISLKAGLEEPLGPDQVREQEPVEQSADTGVIADRETEFDEITVSEPLPPTDGASSATPNSVASSNDVSFLTYPYAGMSIDQLQGKFRFIGASGVGKTSLLIKILVEWVMVNGAEDVTVISTDNQQLAANEALHLTCQLLGVELCHDQSKSSAGANLSNLTDFRNKKLVLIDSASTELQQNSVVLGVRDVVVASAMHSRVALEAQLPRLQTEDRAGFPQMVAITHVDQPFDRQEIAGWLRKASLPVAFLGSSAYLPGGIEIAEALNLSRLFALTDA